MTDDASPSRCAWSVAIFARNEAAALGDCLHHLAAAARYQDVVATVLLNGTRDGSHAALRDVLDGLDLRARVYEIPYADKANAINQFIHRVRPEAETYFFLDGYVSMAEPALGEMAATLAAAPQAHAVASLPTQGRSAAAMRQAIITRKAIAGGLFGLTGAFVRDLAASGLRLPVGYYRGDGLLGSFAVHDLDCLARPWNLERVVVAERAEWATPPRSLWRWRDLQRHLHRKVRQGRGRLEDAAVTDLIYREGFRALPPDADRLILDWIAGDPAARTPGWRRDPFAALALRRIRTARPVAPADLEPKLIFSRGLQ